ncbi:ATP-binding protein [Roseburia hominis]
MTFSSDDYANLQKIMEESPDNQKLIQKLLDYQQYTISKISHEIRNPLALVYSTLQLIESQHPEVQTFKHWNEMREDIEFLTSLLQELSTYNNGERIRPTTFSSYDFLARICLSFAASCTDTEIEFTSRLSPTLPDIAGDKIKLQEVFLNLLQNAKDAVNSSGTIRLEASADSSTLKITVTDNGCGIPPEHLTDIFSPFVTHKSGGTGLGLAISQRVITAHNGTISVDSTPGTGTTFTILLPVSQ